MVTLWIKLILNIRICTVCRNQTYLLIYSTTYPPIEMLGNLRAMSQWSAMSQWIFDGECVVAVRLSLMINALSSYTIRRLHRALKFFAWFSPTSYLHWKLIVLCFRPVLLSSSSTLTEPTWFGLSTCHTAKPSWNVHLWITLGLTLFEANA